jgi:hypothetical protein
MKFLRLTKMLINPATIRTITVSDTRYIIDFTSEKTHGFALFGSGFFRSKSSQIIIDKEKHSTDYRMMQCWLSKNM